LKVSRNSFKLKQPRVPESEVERERLVSEQARFSLISGTVLTITGVIISFGSVIVINVSEGTTFIFAGLVFVALLVTLYISAKFSRYNLNPKDEYEVMQAARAKALAYEFIVPAIVIAIALNNHYKRLSLVGLLLVCLGAARLIEYRQLTQKN
jgi:putative copper export protein